jgi:hypothetical protein
VIAARALVVVVAVAGAACPKAHQPAGEGEGEGEGGEGEGGEGEGEGGGCGSLDARGVCRGDVAEFCDIQTNTVADVACDGAPLFDAGCGPVSPEWGNDCTRPEGAPRCFVFDRAEDAIFRAFCTGAGDACAVTGASDSSCVAGSSPCSEADDGACDGSVFVSCAFIGADGASDGQRDLFDCAALGGVCTPSVGCVAASGDPCTPGVTHCGSVLCPDDADRPSHCR